MRSFFQLGEPSSEFFSNLNLFHLVIHRYGIVQRRRLGVMELQRTKRSLARLDADGYGRGECGRKGGSVGGKEGDGGGSTRDKVGDVS